MPIATHIRKSLLRTCLVAIIAILASATAPTTGVPEPTATAGTRNERDPRWLPTRGDVSEAVLHYQANGARRRLAYLLLPGWYGPRRHPPLPLVIAPHGRGAGPFLELTRAWGALPAEGGFAVVFPEGQGRVLAHHSWGYPGQIDDLARMPQIVRRAVPWLRVDRRRIYAVGGSMGGQEALLLAARQPRLLAGAVAFDAPADMALRYEQFGELENGELLRTLMRREVGATPDEDAAAYAERSPLHFAQTLARSGVPLQLWWSTRDELVVEQQDDSGRLYSELKRLHPCARVMQVVGTWAHTAELRWDRRLPDALHFLGLLPRQRQPQAERS